MRHKNAINNLGRQSSHRAAMLSNMAASLILHKRISTTLQKAKALRSYVEPIITRSKDDTTHSRRVVFGYLQNKEAVTELFRDIAAKIGDRPGGYTRILKTGNRLGDNADMCIIEFVDYNENMLGTKAEVKAKTGRTRRGASKTKTEDVKTDSKVKSEKPKPEVASAVKSDEIEDVKDAVEPEANDQIVPDDNANTESEEK